MEQYKLFEDRTRWMLFEAVELNNWTSRGPSLKDVVVASVADLSLILNYYKPPSESSKVKILSGKLGSQTITNVEAKYVCLASKHLNLDQIQTFHLLRGFIRSEVKLRHQDLAGSLKYDDLLLQKLKNHYLMERQATLFLLAALFRASSSAEHTFHEAARSFVDAITESGKISDTILEQYRQICLIRIPNVLEVDAVAASEWTLINLQEQKAFLELMTVVYYDTISCTSVECLKVMKVLILLELGSKQENRSFFSQEGIDLHLKVCHLNAILAVEILDFETLNSLNTEMLISDKNNNLFADVEMLEEMNELIWNNIVSTGSEPRANGVLCMAWACYCQYLVIILNCKNCPSQYEQFLRGQTPGDRKSAPALFQYGYLNLQGFGFLVQTFQIIGDTTDLIAYKSILKGLWNLFLSTQEVNSLPNMEVLVSFFTELFKGSPELCSQFWCDDFYNEECQSLLIWARNGFPANLPTFCSMVSSLISDEKTAIYAFNYLMQVPSFTDYVRSTDYEMSFENASVMSWVGAGLIQDTRNFSFSAPHGSVGFILGNNIIRLDFVYSAWHLFFAFLDSYLCSNSSQCLSKNAGSLETTYNILNLINLVLEFSDPQQRAVIFDHFEDFTDQSSVYGETVVEVLAGMVGEILNRSCNMANTERLMTCCMDTMRLLLTSHPKIVWKHLRAQRLLPQHSASSFIQDTVIPTECVKGVYDATLAFLNLVCELAKESQKFSNIFTVSDFQERHIEDSEEIRIKFDILSNCVTFILRELFPAYSSWRYVRIDQKFQIGLRSLQIFNTIMRDITWSHLQASRFNLLQELLISHFIEYSGIHQVAPLLDIISLGNSSPLKYHKAQKRTEAFSIEESIVSALGFLKQVLLQLVLRPDSQISCLETCIFDRNTRTSNGTRVELIYTIASYIKYDFNSQFAILATEVLDILCSLASRPNRSLISYVGYFGDQAFTLVSNFVSLVDEASFNQAQDTALQSAIFGFVSTIVSCQPGLGTMFLNGSASNSIGKSGTLSINQSSILHPILNFVKGWKRTCIDSPTVLSSCLQFLDRLWQTGRDHQISLDMLRADTRLWDSLIDLIKSPPTGPIQAKCNLSCYYQISQAHALRILVSEAHIQSYQTKEGTKPSENFTKIFTNVKKVLFNFSSDYVGILCKCSSSFDKYSSLTQEIQRQFSTLSPRMLLGDYKSSHWNDPFDSARLYGKSYIFDDDLLFEKMYNCVFDSDETYERCSAVMTNINLANMEWSRIDAQIAMAQSYSFALRLMVSNLWSVSKDLPDKSDKLTDQNIFDLVSHLCDIIHETHTKTTYVSQTYTAVIASLCFFMIDSLVSIVLDQDICSVCDARIMLIRVLEKLQLCLPSDFYSGGSESSILYQSHIFGSILLTLQALSKFEESASLEQTKDLYDTLKNITPAVCGSLQYLISEDISTHADIDKKSQDETVLIACLFEISRIDYGESQSIWRAEVEKAYLIPLLISKFSRWQPRSYAGQKAIGSGLVCENNIPAQILEVFLSFGGQSPKAMSSVLVAHGVMEIFFNNAFRSFILESHIDTNQDEDMVLDVESRPDETHRVWCLMLALVTRLLFHLDADQSFYEYCFGFHQLYNQRFAKVMNIGERGLSVSEFEEIERISEFHYALAKSYLSIVNCRNGTSEKPIPRWIAEFQNTSLGVMSIFGFLFKSPHEMESRMKLGLASYKENSVNCQQIEDSAILKGLMKMRSIIRTLISFIMLSSKTLVQLCGDQDLNSNISAQVLIFQPTMASSSMSGASFGTLFELIRYFTGLTRKRFEKINRTGLFTPERDEENIQILVILIESCLTLLFSQLTILASSSAYEDDEGIDTISDIRLELLDEYKSALKDLLDLIAGAGSSIGRKAHLVDIIKESKFYLSFLMSNGSIALIS